MDNSSTPAVLEKPRATEGCRSSPWRPSWVRKRCRGSLSCTRDHVRCGICVCGPSLVGSAAVG
eukprot:13231826-Alexandrium_andersonii.AAC.1